jgi:hypothetical protein
MMTGVLPGELVAVHRPTSTACTGASTAPRYFPSRKCPADGCHRAGTPTRP